MTIQLWTIQIPTIQFPKKYLRDHVSKSIICFKKTIKKYLSLINIYMAFFPIYKILNIKKNYKIIINNYI